MYVTIERGHAVRYVVAPAGTAAGDLGTQEVITDPAQARLRADAQGLSVYIVTVTVTETVEV